MWTLAFLWCRSCREQESRAQSGDLANERATKCTGLGPILILQAFMMMSLRLRHWSPLLYCYTERDLPSRCSGRSCKLESHGINVTRCRWTAATRFGKRHHYSVPACLWPFRAGCQSKQCVRVRTGHIVARQYEIGSPQKVRNERNSGFEGVWA